MDSSVPLTLTIIGNAKSIYGFFRFKGRILDFLKETHPKLKSALKGVFPEGKNALLHLTHTHRLSITNVSNRFVGESKGNKQVQNFSLKTSPIS